MKRRGGGHDVALAEEERTVASDKERNITPADFSPFDERHYKELWRRQVVRLLLSYLAPLVLAVGYFAVQYDQLASESRRLHLQAIAGSHAITWYFRETLVGTEYTSCEEFEVLAPDDD